jgi:hypothetical protein
MPAHTQRLILAQSMLTTQQHHLQMMQQRHWQQVRWQQWHQQQAQQQQRSEEARAEREEKERKERAEAERLAMKEWWRHAPPGGEEMRSIGVTVGKDGVARRPDGLVDLTPVGLDTTFHHIIFIVTKYGVLYAIIRRTIRV